MKLLVKSDDYGFTKAVTAGVYDAMKNGIITSTGLFSNMPSAKKAVEFIQDCPHVCFGIDINVVSGPCVSDPKKIPSLVDPQTKEFIRSTVKYKDDRFQRFSENEALWPLEECYIEACAQIEKYMELVGKKPEYVTGHSISTHALNYGKAIRKAAARYEIPFAQDLLEKYDVQRLPSLNVKPFTIEVQLQANVEEYTLEQLKKYQDAPYVLIGGHCGFVDTDLMKYSTYTIIRAKDHQMYTSKRIMDWLKENHVELISFRDLV